MKKELLMNRPTLVAALAAAMLAVPCLAAEEAPKAKAEPKIQIAILLDTSSSMDGLINQTREQLWRIVNTFATARRDGQRPRLELALYQYGNQRLSSESGYIERLLPLTTDLDKVSEALFKLSTNGGDEYCGQVIEKAVTQLEWSSSPGDLKLIYIAGNEPFSQGPVNFKAAVKGAISRGVVVNTIHAGSELEGVNGHWKEAALLADGHFISIDQNRAVARVAAPQDQELVKLNESLNRTYLGYGPTGGESVARQAAQDSNAAAMSPSSLATRATAKAGAHYDNSSWDVVDARKKGKTVAAEALPEELRKLSPEAREKLIDEKAKERAELQAKIAALAKDRDAFVQAEIKKQAKSGAKTLDDAVIDSARVQATKRSFSLE
jgi:hypothetical protein